MIDILIVDDSPVARRLLTHIFSADPDLHVVGIAVDGQEALDAVRRHRPQVVTMDIHMPVLDGFEATRRIMQSHPVPIVMISGSYDPTEVSKAFRSMEEGAFAILARPVGPEDPHYEWQAREICQTIHLAAATVPRRRQASPTSPMAGSARGPIVAAGAAGPVRLVAIGASTGGPPALQTILASLPPQFPVPIVIVQHIASGFVEGMIQWLNNTSGPLVCLAHHRELLQAGHAYVAPDGAQMGVSADGTLAMLNGPPEHGLCPSVSHLFRSVATHYRASAIGVLLTGMGRDGAAELAAMRQLGAVTIVQNRESCAVFGMPGQAVDLGGAMHQLPPDQIARMLLALAGSRPAGRPRVS